MRKTKSFLVRQQYYANYGTYDRSNDTPVAVPISDYDAIKANLFKLTSNPNELKQLLRSEFVYKEVVGTYSDIVHNTFPTQYAVVNGMVVPIPNTEHGTGQKNTDTYEEHQVALVVEELVVNHYDDFRALLKASSPECQKELLDFTGLDLEKADLSGLDYSKINFTDSDLRFTQKMTQSLLNKSETYVGAKLPPGMIAFWTAKKKDAVLAGIKKLERYGKALKDSPLPGASKRGESAIALAKTLEDKITNTIKYNGAFQNDFLTTLNEGKKQFVSHLDHGLSMILTNIALCVLGGGIFYAAALLAHRYQTGRYLFFSRPETEQLAAAISESVIVP
jgi:hypothetical protein